MKTVYLLIKHYVICDRCDDEVKCEEVLGVFATTLIAEEYIKKLKEYSFPRLFESYSIRPSDIIAA